MHLITRGVDEAFVVDDNIIVRVVEIAGDEVRLAIASPHSRPRYREVVLRRESDYDRQEDAVPELLATR
jgi:carbon storage regulator CsrA